MDLTRPWLAPLQPCLDQALAALDCGASVAQALNSAASRPPCGTPRFVPQPGLPEGEAYESFIARTDSVPTRDKLHDLFNGLCWLRFPETKRSGAAVSRLAGAVHHPPQPVGRCALGHRWSCAVGEASHRAAQAAHRPCAAGRPADAERRPMGGQTLLSAACAGRAGLVARQRRPVFLR